MLIVSVMQLINGNSRDFLPMLLTALFFGGLWFLLSFISRKIAIRTWKKKGLLPEEKD